MRIALLHVQDDRPRFPVFDQTLALLNATTVDAVSALGWEAELFASGAAAIEDSLEAAARADAVVIMGGEDVTPRLYGGESDYPGAGEHDLGADAAHLAVVRRAVEVGQPLLGICRGLQLVNVALGGTLIQHLPTTGHRAAGTGLGSFARSQIRLLDGSHDLSADVHEMTVRCTHHQAVDRLGTGLTVAARAADGVVEAVVHQTAPVTAVQWHPEHPEAAHSELIPLLRRLERQSR